MVRCGDRCHFWVMISMGTCCTHHFLSVSMFYLWNKEILQELEQLFGTTKWKCVQHNNHNAGVWAPAPRSCRGSPRPLTESSTWERMKFLSCCVYCIWESIYYGLRHSLTNGTITCCVSKGLPHGWCTTPEQILATGTHLSMLHFPLTICLCQIATVLSRKNSLWVYHESLQQLGNFLLALIYAGCPWNNPSSNYKRLAFLMSKHSLCG